MLENEIQLQHGSIPQIQTDYHQENFQQNEKDRSPVHDEDTIIEINQYQQDNNIVPDQLDNWHENIFRNEDTFQYNINHQPHSGFGPQHNEEPYDRNTEEFHSQQQQQYYIHNEPDENSDNCYLSTYVS